MLDAEPVGVGCRFGTSQPPARAVGSAPNVDPPLEADEGEASGSVRAILAVGSGGEVRLDGRVVGGVLPAGRVEGGGLELCPR